MNSLFSSAQASAIRLFSILRRSSPSIRLRTSNPSALACSKELHRSALASAYPFCAPAMINVRQPDVFPMLPGSQLFKRRSVLFNPGVPLFDGSAVPGSPLLSAFLAGTFHSGRGGGFDAFAVSVDAAWIERFSVWFRVVIGGEYPQERCAKSSTRPDHLLRPDQRVEILAADIAEAERLLA
jgi:hypothetical protein